MAKETFGDRLKRLLDPHSDGEIAHVMGYTTQGIRKMKDGSAKTMSIQDALRLCAHFKASPWWLAGIADPATAMRPESAWETGSRSPVDDPLAQVLAEIANIRRDLTPLIALRPKLETLVRQREKPKRPA